MRAHATCAGPTRPDPTRPDPTRLEARWLGAMRSERGSAVVEFTLVGVLLSVLFLGLLQLGLALHVRNTLAASATEGARYAANADREPEQGVAVTRTLIRDSLADAFAGDVRGGFELVDRVPTVYVEVRATLPLVGLLGPRRGIVVRGHALEEAR